MEVGELWVYHPTKFDAIHCAQVLTIGKKVKVKVRQPDWLSGKHTVDRDELRVPWDERDAYEATVKPFMDLADMSGPEEAEWNAVEVILVATGLTNEINFHVWGCAETYDATLVARACRISVDSLTKAPGTVVDDNNYAAFPWETMLRLAKRLASTRAETILEYVRSDEEFWDERAREAATSQMTGLDKEEYQNLKRGYLDMFTAEWQLVRQWCGIRRAKQSDELAQLRDKYAQLVDLANVATEGLPPSRRNAQLVEEINTLIAPDRQ